MNGSPDFSMGCMEVNTLLATGGGRIRSYKAVPETVSFQEAEEGESAHF